MNTVINSEGMIKSEVICLHIIIHFIFNLLTASILVSHCCYDKLTESNIISASQGH